MGPAATCTHHDIIGIALRLRSCCYAERRTVLEARLDPCAAIFGCAVQRPSLLVG
jgi:hypothetical protein